MRRLLAYLLGLPFALIGEFAAHQGAYLAIYGSQAEAALGETGHGYLAHLPTFAVALGVVLLAAVLVDGFLLARGRPSSRLPLRTFLLIGPAAFAVQEFAERWAETGHFPWWAWTEATFLIGLLLQLPTSWVAFHVARAILRPIRRVAQRIAELVLQPGRPAPQPGRPAPTIPIFAQRVRASLLVPGCVRGRAPPLTA